MVFKLLNKIMENKKILFVCLGNICRSPMAECVMKKISDEKKLGWEISSCGLISYHQGEQPDSRMISAARKKGYNLEHKARKIREEDFSYYDFIIGMDRENIQKLVRLSPPSCRRKIRIISEFFDGVDDYDCVPDPYYGETEDFFTVISLLENACTQLAAQI